MPTTRRFIVNRTNVFAQATNKNPILIVARNSSYGSRSGRALAAQEVHEIVRRLASNNEIDLTVRVPSVNTIAADLANCRTRISRPRLNGKGTVDLEYVEYHLGDVVVLVATGTGKAATADLSQPFVELVCAKLKEHSPCVVAVNRFDRVGRAGAALTGPIFNTLQLLNIPIADEQSTRVIDDMQAVFGGMQAMASKSEAVATFRKTRQGISRGTDREFGVDGCAYAVGYDPPPGLIRVRLESDRGGLGQQWLALDDPNHHPDLAVVAYGLAKAPQAKERHSNMNDVMWALSVLGAPGWTQAEVGRQLISRGFSTSGLRRYTGVAATFADSNIPSDDAGRVLRAILTNLNFYRTGVLQVHLNHDDVPDFSITGVFPPSGAWARPEDFERIEKYLAETVGGGPASLPLTGVPVSTRVGPAVLGCAALPGKRDHYTVRMLQRTSQARRVNCG